MDEYIEFKVAAICSFSDDEPVKEILDAADALPTVFFYISGDKSRASKQILNRKQKNVKFTGFLSKSSYVDVLREVDAIIVLTKNDKTMLAGAYEALSLQKPLITSNWKPLRRYFNKGTIHVDNSSSQIESAIRIAQEKKEELEKQCHQHKFDKMGEWKIKLGAFRKLLLHEYALHEYAMHRTQEKESMIDRIAPSQPT